MRTNRGRQSDLKVKERARAPGGGHVVMCKKGDGDKRGFTGLRKAVTSWRRIRLLLAVLAV